MSIFKFDAKDFCGLIIVLFLVTGCSTPELARPNVAIVSALPWQSGDTGFYFSLADRQQIVAEGVPDAYFVSTPRGYFLSELNEEKAAAILAQKRNSGVWKP